MTYSPNLPIGTGWKSTLQVAFQTLRRVKFIIENDFRFVEFDPNPSFGGMTVTNYSAPKCRILILNKIAFVSINISATLAAPFTNIVTVTLPDNIITSISASQKGATQIANAGAEEVGIWQSLSGTNTIGFLRTVGGVGTNYSAGVWNIRLNTFLEIE